MKIAIFGASVSAQTVNHSTGEVTGYAEVLRREHAVELGATEIRQITYPGNRLSDGGLLLLSDVVAWRPDICLFEPLIEDGSRGKNSLEVEKRYAFVTLLDAGILPVTLLLPDPLRRPAREMPHYNQFIGISRQYGLPVIEIDLTGLADLEEKFNGVHTLLAGARIYARQIVAGLKGLRDPCCLANEALARVMERGRPELTVLPIALPPNPPKRIREIEIILVSNYSDPLSVRLVQPQNIGIFSPVLDLELRREGVDKQVWFDTLSVWDSYCHYTRFSFVTLANLELKEAGSYLLTLRVSEALPDYSRCRRPISDWPDDRYLEPMGRAVLIASKPIEVCINTYGEF